MPLAILRKPCATRSKSTGGILHVVEFTKVHREGDRRVLVESKFPESGQHFADQEVRKLGKVRGMEDSGAFSRSLPTC